MKKNQLSNIILQSNNIHLWLSFPNEIFENSLLSAYWEILSKDEQKKQQRFYFEKDRHLYLVSHALVRTTLSLYTGIDPKRLGFFQNRYGRPELFIGETSLPLRFNLSHTDGLIACAVVLKEDIGVDVERIKRSENYMEIANSYFSDNEKYELNMINDDDKKKRFIDYWTLKESYTKAKGMGLYMPLEKFSFHILDFERISVNFDPELADNPEQWQFYLLKPIPDYRVSLSVSKTINTSMKVKTKKVVPLNKGEIFDCDILNQSY